MRYACFAAVLAVLSGCNPVAYVPAPIASSPTQAGLVAGGSLNGASLQAVGDVTVSPGGGFGVTARGLLAATPSREAGGYLQRGRELGAVGALPASPGVAVELGAFTGLDRMSATDYRADIGCCSGEYVDVELRVERAGGHLGIWFDVPRSDGATTRVGPALRVTQVRVREDGGAPGTVSGVGQAATFAEPALRAEVQYTAIGVSGQVGLTLLGEGDFFDRYDTVPYFMALGATYRLFGPD